MKTKAGAAVMIFLGLVSVACATETPGSGSGGSGGEAVAESGGGSDGGASATGGGGSASTGQPETIATVCQDACDVILPINDQLGCEAIPTCVSDCKQGIYPGCENEYFVMMKCWAESADLSICSCGAGNFLQCDLCQAEINAYQTCGGGF